MDDWWVCLYVEAEPPHARAAVGFGYWRGGRWSSRRQRWWVWHCGGWERRRWRWDDEGQLDQLLVRVAPTVNASREVQRIFGRRRREELLPKEVIGRWREGAVRIYVVANQPAAAWQGTTGHFVLLRGRRCSLCQEDGLRVQRGHLGKVVDHAVAKQVPAHVRVAIRADPIVQLPQRRLFAALAWPERVQDGAALAVELHFADAAIRTVVAEWTKVTNGRGAIVRVGAVGGGRCAIIAIGVILHDTIPTGHTVVLADGQRRLLQSPVLVSGSERLPSQAVLVALCDGL